MNTSISSSWTNPGVRGVCRGLPFLLMFLWGSAQASCPVVNGVNGQDIDISCPTNQLKCQPAGWQGSGNDVTFEFTVGNQIPDTDIGVINTTSDVFWQVDLGNPPTCSGTAGSYNCNGIIVTLPLTHSHTGKVTIKGKPTGAPNSSNKSSLKLTVTDINGIGCDRLYVFHGNGGGGWGDPHLTTMDGVNYDFQAAGEFVALRGDGLEIQTRQTPVATDPPPGFANGYTGISSCVSLYTAVAARVGTHRVTYQPNISGVPDPSGMQLRVDGDQKTLGSKGISLNCDPGQTFDAKTHANPACGRITKTTDANGKDNGIEIDFPNQSKLVVTSSWWDAQKKWYLNVNASNTAAFEGTMGLIADNWLPRLPGGGSVGPKPKPLHDRYVELNETFANAWRVTDATSLFDYADNTSTATFTVAGWPRENPTSCLIRGEPTAQPTTTAIATESCSQITDKNRRANCEFDVAVTGNTGFADSYASAQRLVPGLTETTVKDDKDPTNYGEAVTFTATVAAVVSRSGFGNPAGSVQFMLDYGKVGSPVALDGASRAKWATSALLAGNHRIQAIYMPSPGSKFLPSTSPEESHTVIATTDQWFWFIVIVIVVLLILLIRWFRQKP